MTRDAGPPEGAIALARMIDFKIPLPWLLGGFIVAVGAFIAMYYQLQSVSETLKEVRITLATTTEVMSRLSNQQTLMQYRIEKLEAVGHFTPSK